MCVQYELKTKNTNRFDDRTSLVNSTSSKEDDVPCDFDLDLTHKEFNMCKKCGKHRREHKNTTKSTKKKRKRKKRRPKKKREKSDESTKVSEDLSRPAVILRAASNSHERKQREEEEAANRLYKFLENEITKSKSIFHDDANANVVSTRMLSPSLTLTHSRSNTLVQFMKDNYGVKSAEDIATRISTENLKRDLLRKKVSKEQILWFRYLAYRFETRHLKRLDECPVCYEDESNVVILFL